MTENNKKENSGATSKIASPPVLPGIRTAGDVVQLPGVRTAGDVVQLL